MLWGLAATFKDSFESCLPVIKNVIQLGAYYHIVQDLSKPSKLEGIINCILHLDALGGFYKPMLMVPESIRAKAHFIDKKQRFIK